MFQNDLRDVFAFINQGEFEHEEKQPPFMLSRQTLPIIHLRNDVFMQSKQGQF